MALVRFQYGDGGLVQATREAMLMWLGNALEANREHDKEMPDVSVAASRGFMLNLAAVMLRICKPFLDPSSGKAWSRLDIRSALPLPL